ncbi:alpha/beta hydrolase family protein [Hydrogenoanaerobacterium sp.]|uniref:alpha/beta hydrolase n=1 Tax=Hydrogenoanaerobacterium sp. TaxID=2953763 RepID=UPI00289775D3|nr:alpha/beta hydrolase family protein [Hydrogenoanaerobacterium sp.]
MILCQCNFFSKALKNHVTLNVLIPSMPDNDCLHASYSEIYPEGKKHKTLYLLHGALDDYSSWLRHTNIERYAEEKGIAVVMPSGQNGFYTNAVSGHDYFDFITEELPHFVQATFHLSSKREDNFIAGPSMGGYGASKCALSKPEQYGAFGCLSGAVNPPVLEGRMKAMGFDFFRYDLIFDGTDKIPGTNHDLYKLAGGLTHAEHKPRSYIFCGIQDVANHDMNVALYEKLKEAGSDTTFCDGDGLHDWAYWDKCIGQFIQWL